MNLLNFFKNLFNKKTKQMLSGKKDIFGHDILVNEYVLPIVYNETRRRGYLTVLGKNKSLQPNELTDDMLKHGVIREKTLILKNLAGKVVQSKRSGFYHILCDENEIIVQ